MSPKGVKGLAAFWRIGFFIQLLIGSYFFLLFYIHFLMVKILVFIPSENRKSDLGVVCTKMIPKTLDYTPLKSPVDI